MAGRSDDLWGGAEGLSQLLQMIPYANFLGITGEIDDRGAVLVMHAQRRLVGNPVLRALHGGTVGALLETAAVCGAMWQGRLDRVPKTITITIDYLRSGRLETTRARASIAKHGRRVVSVQVQAYQADPQNPIAAAHAHLLVGGHDSRKDK